MESNLGSQAGNKIKNYSYISIKKNIQIVWKPHFLSTTILIEVIITLNYPMKDVSYFPHHKVIRSDGVLAEKRSVSFLWSKSNMKESDKHAAGPLCAEQMSLVRLNWIREVKAGPPGGASSGLNPRACDAAGFHTIQSPKLILFISHESCWKLTKISAAAASGSASA